MTVKSLYPTALPSLNLDFANSKKLDPRVTYTRASTGTFVNENGLVATAASGAARFDHDPVTGKCLGLLVEEARTNYLRPSVPDYSGGFGTWSNGSAPLSANAGTAPDGTNTAVLTAWNTVSGAERMYYDTGTPTSLGITEIHSFFVKAKTPGAGDKFVVTFQGVNWSWLNGLSSTKSFTFDFDTQTLSANTGTGYQTSITAFANGWYRISIPAINNGVGVFNTYVAINRSSQVGNWYIWGCQRENGTFPTSYIPTTTATVTRAADVATLSNTNSSIFPTSAFTVVNSPFGTAGGGSTVKLVGPTIARTAVYNGDLTQAQINALAGVNDGFWRWRVTGASFALPTFTTDGSVTVDWGDGVVETLTTTAHTFTDSNAYHTIGFRLNSGTYFRPYINNNATYKAQIIAIGPAPASMKIDAFGAFYIGATLKAFDATVDVTGGTSFQDAWRTCSGLTSFPLINTSAATNFTNTWNGCSSLTSFPLINTAAVTNFLNAWSGCSGLTSFPLINTAAATSLRGAWGTCSGLTSFPLINSTACTNFLEAWLNCSSLTSFPLINTGAGTNFQSTWQGCSGLASFPLINTAAGTSFLNAWKNCSSLTSFPLISTGAGTNFNGTWDACSNLTSFPLINTGAGTIFTYTWRNCSSLTSFPLINLSAGTDFNNAWASCSSLTSFPAISFTSATFLGDAWDGCTNLATFPANVFNTTGTLTSTAFIRAFSICALTAASIENILTSLVTNGQSNITLGLSGGTNAGAATWTTAANTAYATLISRGWTITRNP